MGSYETLYKNGYEVGRSFYVQADFCYAKFRNNPSRTAELRRFIETLLCNTVKEGGGLGGRGGFLPDSLIDTLIAKIKKIEHEKVLKFGGQFSEIREFFVDTFCTNSLHISTNISGG